MKMYSILIVLLSVLSITATAQVDSSPISVGDQFVIGPAANNAYKFIKFPRANFIVKRGGIVNYSSIKNKVVEVVKIKNAKGGELVGTIKLTSGKKFFNSHRNITVDILGAIEQGELIPHQINTDKDSTSLNASANERSSKDW